jgi:hypothetical protein
VAAAAAAAAEDQASIWTWIWARCRGHAWPNSTLCSYASRPHCRVWVASAAALLAPLSPTDSPSSTPVSKAAFESSALDLVAAFKRLFSSPQCGTFILFQKIYIYNIMKCHFKF